MTTKLQLFNGCLRNVGERKLASLTEGVETRRLLDDIWDDGAVRFVLELGQWNFAVRTSQLTYSPSVSEPDFGYQYAFDRPTDLVRLIAISGDEYFSTPLTAYRPEGEYFWSDLDTIYIQYVSDDDAYGADMSLWPQSFVKLFQAYLARELGPRLKNFNDMDRVNQEFKTKLADAKAKDAMEGPSSFSPPGTWVQSRSRGDYRSKR